MLRDMPPTREARQDGALPRRDTQLESSRDGWRRRGAPLAICHSHAPFLDRHRDGQAIIDRRLLPATGIA